MKQLYTLALSKYQNHLNIIQHLKMLNALTEQQYCESREAAKRIWETDNEMLEVLELRKRIIEGETV